MSSDEFRALAQRLDKRPVRLAPMLGVSRRQCERYYFQGISPPLPVAALLRRICEDSGK